MVDSHFDFPIADYSRDREARENTPSLYVTQSETGEGTRSQEVSCTNE